MRVGGIALSLLPERLLRVVFLRFIPRGTYSRYNSQLCRTKCKRGLIGSHAAPRYAKDKLVLI